MDLNEYVYCVRCKNFELNADDIYRNVCPAKCQFEEECYFWDWEDGRRFGLRRHYEPKE